MKRIVVLVAAIVACSKPDASSTATVDAASATPPPPPFTGALTGERIIGSRGLAHPFNKWLDALARLEGQMGKATLVKDDKKFSWGVVQGDDCWYVEVEKQADGTVGMVADPMKVSKGGPIMNYDACLTAAGVRKDAVEDPNALPPPTDGKPIGVIAFRDGAMKARSKWTKAKVTVQGLYMNVTNLQSNGVAMANISITAAKADLQNIITCDLADASSAPTKMMQYTPIKVTGTVAVNDMLTGGGDRVLDVELKDCSIVH